MWVRISLLAYILMCQSVRTNFAPARVNAMYILIFLSLSLSPSLSLRPSTDVDTPFMTIGPWLFQPFNWYKHRADNY